MTMKRSLRFEKNPAFHLEMSPRQIDGGFCVLPPQVGNIWGVKRVKSCNQANASLQDLTRPDPFIFAHTHTHNGCVMRAGSKAGRGC